MTITKEFYEDLVDEFKNNTVLNPLGVAKITYDNYWKWECRATLARHLIKSEQYRETAIALMETVLEHEPNDYEHQAWALKDLAFWKFEYRNDSSVIPLLEKSLKLIRENVEEPLYLNEAELWFDYLYLLCKTNQNKKALDELEIIKGTKSKLKEPDYLYFANLFEAYYTFKYENDLDLAIEYLKRSLACFNRYEDLNKYKSIVYGGNVSKDTFFDVINQLKSFPIYYSNTMQ